MRQLVTNTTQNSTQNNTSNCSNTSRNLILSCVLWHDFGLAYETATASDQWRVKPPLWRTEVDRLGFTPWQMCV